MSPCYNCSARPRLASIDFGTVPLQAGDVCHIQESLMRPIESALKVNLKKLMSIVTLGNHTIDTSRTQDSLWPGFKDRPCIITEVDTSGPQQKITLCVMGTMNGKRIETLPYAIRYFCVPMASLNHRLPRSDIHFHTLPEWESPRPAWIVAHEFVSTQAVGERWKGHHSGSHHRSDLHVVHNLRQTSVNKYEHWQRRFDNDAPFREYVRREYTQHMLDQPQYRSRRTWNTLAKSLAFSKMSPNKSRSQHRKRTKRRDPLYMDIDHDQEERNSVNTNYPAGSAIQEEFHDEPMDGIMPTYTETANGPQGVSGMSHANYQVVHAQAVPNHVMQNAPSGSGSGAVRRMLSNISVKTPSQRSHLMRIGSRRD